MKKKQKAMLGMVMGITFISAALFLPGLISGGDLEPSAPPGSTMHTLEEIYSLIAARVGGVPVTGQTTSYATGDDGDLEKGVSSPVPRFTDNGDGTVTDNLTGLIWLKNANCAGTKTWADAVSWANGLYDGCGSCGGTNDDCNLSDGSSAGDWRLPNVKELLSLIDYGRNNPALPSGHPFTGVQNSNYRSSTTYEGNTDYAWYVYMSSGYTSSGDKTYNVNVWPVRGGN